MLGPCLLFSGGVHLREQELHTCFCRDDAPHVCQHTTLPYQPSTPDVAHLRDPAFLVRALRYRSARLLHTLAARLRKHSRRLGEFKVSGRGKGRWQVHMVQSMHRDSALAAGLETTCPDSSAFLPQAWNKCLLHVLVSWGLETHPGLGHSEQGNSSWVRLHSTPAPVFLLPHN